MMSAAATVTDRLPGLPGSSIEAVENLCRLFSDGDTAAAAAARMVVGTAAEWQPPLRSGLDKAVPHGTTGVTARCLLVLAASAVDSGTAHREMTARAGQDSEPRARARHIAARAATVEADGEGPEAVAALLADVAADDVAEVVTTWARMAATAVARTPR